MISLFWSSISVLRTFLGLLDVTIVSRVVFPDVLSCFFMVLHIFAYSNRCLTLSNISHRFVIRARVVDNVLNFSDLLFALAALDALCWITSVMVLLMVSMSSSSCNVSNRFLN